MRSERLHLTISGTFSSIPSSALIFFQRFDMAFMQGDTALESCLFLELFDFPG